ncbi:helix-turn-helix domain-containing protein [Paenibacillus sp. GXUN7292]|uniref:helix-turn-helix domain-containing protein n=1 Tax=Paenibacillus sp. GXUN7292 TaxID=3422499 RepID=UPI003D7D3305
MSLGLRIKELRKKSKLTQKGLASKLGIDHTTISKWEADVYEPDTTTLSKLADLFDVDTDYLLCRTDKPKKEVDNNSGRAYLDGGKDWTEEEIKAADEFIQMLRRRSKQQDK